MLDSYEIMTLPTFELINVMQHGHISSNVGSDLKRVVSHPRLRPRAELPLLYASDGSLHRGRAATAASGYRRRKQDGDANKGAGRRSFAARAALTTSGPTPAPEPSPKTPKLGGLKSKWSRVTEKTDGQARARRCFRSVLSCDARARPRVIRRSRPSTSWRRARRRRRRRRASRR